MRPEDVSCPWCRARAGSLTVNIELIVEPFGRQSLSGHTLKTTARYVPMLTCGVCNAFQFGRWDDEHHAVFSIGGGRDGTRDRP